FAFGVILTYKIPSNISFIDVFQKLFLTFYVLAITIIIIFLFEFLSLSIFTYLVLNAIYTIFLFIIFIIFIRDTYKLLLRNRT
ncbi:MAG: hypothetical protein QW401_00350, partial [Thermoplasmata archaeon]